MKKINIVIMGAPNSGKGTVCEKLCTDFNLFHLSTGQILRDNIEKGTPLVEKAKPHMLSVVSDELVNEMVENELENLEGYSGVVFDGYPRTLSQALALDRNVKPNLIILLDYNKNDENKLILRAINRFICPNCKATLSAEMLEGELCPHCKTKAVRRDDASEENAKKRIDVFKSETVPVIHYFGSRVVKVNAFAGKEELIKNVENIVKSVLVKNDCN